jgi:hypothetical protein
MHYRLFPVLTGIFVTCLIISNIIAIKPIAIGPLFVPVAIIIFPISYLLGDILTEIYGYGRARQVIWIGFTCNAFSALVLYLSIKIPPASFWMITGFPSSDKAQEAYTSIFSFTPRLLAASFAAYLVGEFLNAYIMAKIKILMRGQYLWIRTISSTVVGQLADSTIFTTSAFYGVMPPTILMNMVFTQWLIKSLYEASLTPVTYVIVHFLKKIEHLDFYDYKTKFNPFTLK